MNHMKQPHPDDNKRMLVFFVLAMLIMGLSYVFITKPNMERMRAQQTAAIQKETRQEVAVETETKLQKIDTVLTDSKVKRIAIDTPELQGSIAATGLRFDDIELKSYYQTLKNDALVRLLAPSNTSASYFVEIGVMPADQNIRVPQNNTAWKVVSGKTLTPETPVVLEWANGQGLTFRRIVTVDRRYVISVAQEIANNTGADVTLYPYALVSQAHHKPEKGEKISFEEQDTAIQHVGPIGYLNDDLIEESYEDVVDEKTFKYDDVTGWLGITSKYWMVSLLPENDAHYDARITHQKGTQEQDIYQTDLRQNALVVPAGETVVNNMRFFAGAKKLNILTDYTEELDIPKFDLAVDFGVLYILTKPLYTLLSWMGNYFHDTYGYATSFGIALLLLTVLVRLVLFPLQNKSYKAMNRMKDLGPKIHALKEKHGEDKVKFQQDVMELYKKEKVNPASGCLPILIQIPIFFALYKVIYITLDMRHAPFWGWVNDLSAPDPTNAFSLFGVLPFSTPEFLVIGAWPILYGVTMWLQQRLNPQPEDAMQKQIFAMLPWVFMFIFAKFPAGLVIYYTWSNLLGVVQQYSIRLMNPDLAPPKKPRKKKAKKKVSEQA